MNPGIDEEMIRGLIFDFDGLILDTEGPVFQSWQELYQSFGCDLLLSEWADYIGRSEGTYDFFNELEGKLGWPLDRLNLAPKRRAREAELVEQQTVLPGVPDYLESAKRLGLKLGLASSSSCARVTGHLNRLGLWSYFDCLRAADDVEHTKPDPSLYLAVLAELELAPNQAIALEDSPNGILAAKHAGMYCVAVPNTLTRLLPLDHADLQIRSLADLPLENLLSIVNKNSN